MSGIRKKRLSWLYWIIILVFILPLGLLAVGFIYQTIASRSDWDRYPPPGELVDIGGYELHIHCTGERRGNQPVVVIEAGSGSFSKDWALVQPEIAKFTRVCSYDRAGLGWSDPGPEPRSSQQYASELRILLDKVGEEPPYVFVAHSLGVHTVRIYAQAHPEDVVGMVFVDGRHPTMESATIEMGSGQLKLWEFLSRCGFFRLVGKQAWEAQSPSFAKIPDYPYPVLLAPKYFETGRLESLVILESDHQAAATGPFGDLPLVVIAHEIPNQFASLPPGEMEAAEEIWQTGQRDLAGLSTRSQFLIAEGSGHNIPVENPGIIIEVVRSMLDEYRQE